MEKGRLRCLIACECSGRVRAAFAERNWEAWSADILPSEVKPIRTYYPDPGKWHHFGDVGKGWHYQGDCRDLFNWNHPVNHQRATLKRIPQLPYVPLWDLIIAHPPCTDLSYAGARWFKDKDARRGGDGRMQAAAEFFIDMLNAPSPCIAVENPHSIIQEEQWAGKPTQVVQPWWFGDPYEKQIHLWLKGLPSLMIDDPVRVDGRIATGGGSWRTDKAAGKQAMSAFEDSEGRVNRAKVRSRTMPGLARAMAGQWGKFAEEYYNAG